MSNLMQICACAMIYWWTKKLRKIRTGPSGLWTIVGCGPVVTKGRNDLLTPTTIYNHLEKFNDLVVITRHKESNTFLKKP